MFSYEDRIRTVQLYIKLGKRVGLTIRQLGFPTKNMLKHWYQVAYYLEHGRCFAATIKALGYPSRT